MTTPTPSRRFGIQPIRNWTLRSRLVAGLLSLFVVLSLAIGAFTELSLRSFLVDKLDAQLKAATAFDPTRLRAPEPPFGQDLPDETRQFFVPQGSPAESVNVTVTSTRTVGLIAHRNQYSQELAPTAAVAKLAEVTSTEPTTVSVPGLGDYRAVAGVTPSGLKHVLAYPLSDINATLWRLTIIITALTVSGLIFAGMAGAWIVRLALRPLRKVTDTAARVAEMQLDEGEVALAVRVPEPNPHTEVGQVGVALNHMLENVSDALNARHQSEMRVRQFVADASHELRTPLASIRGYAELTRRSLPTAPDDVRHAMSRVESEANRMTSLVEDLLLLARLDAGRPLDVDEVDLTRLLVDAIGDAHAASPEHAWHLDVPDDPITITGDAARLHQVVTNLLANARTHTPTGTKVTVSLATQGDWARIDVADNGPGIASDKIDGIFVRFARADESRSRANGSTGLGLAIAQAVAQAHGGHIAVASQPGRTVFTVWLPLTSAPAAATHRNPQGTTQEPSSVGHQALEV